MEITRPRELVYSPYTKNKRRYVYRPWQMVAASSSVADGDTAADTVALTSRSGTAVEGPCRAEDCHHLAD